MAYMQFMTGQEPQAKKARFGPPAMMQFDEVKSQRVRKCQEKPSPKLLQLRFLHMNQYPTAPEYDIPPEYENNSGILQCKLCNPKSAAKPCASVEIYRFICFPATINGFERDWPLRVLGAVFRLQRQ